MTRKKIKPVKAWAAVDSLGRIQMVDWHKSEIVADVDARAFNCRAVRVLITPITPKPRRKR
jgi:hypothetical protein